MLEILGSNQINTFFPNKIQFESKGLPMSKSKISSAVVIDAANTDFLFCSAAGNGAPTVRSVANHHIGAHFDEDFFKNFSEALKSFAKSMPSGMSRKITVVLPDRAVLTDSVQLPAMRSTDRTEKMLDITLRNLYREDHSLQIVSREALRSKQYVTYTVAAVQKRWVADIYKACSENKLTVDTLTYASGAAIAGAVTVNPALKNASYLFLDIKSNSARFVFVADGKTVGHYALPFGYEFLENTQTTDERALFDHSYAELIVLNAREAAQEKALSVTAPGAQHPNTGSKTREDSLIEKFRIFIKWALLLLDGNESLTSIAKPSFLCVNLPDALRPVLDRANGEIRENGISILPLCEGSRQDALAHLELYGGLFPKQIDPMSKF